MESLHTIPVCVSWEEKLCAIISETPVMDKSNAQFYTVCNSEHCHQSGLKHRPHKHFYHASGKTSSNNRMCLPRFSLLFVFTMWGKAFSPRTSIFIPVLTVLSLESYIIHQYTILHKDGPQFWRKSLLKYSSLCIWLNPHSPTTTIATTHPETISLPARLIVHEVSSELEALQSYEFIQHSGDGRRPLMNHHRPPLSHSCSCR